MDTNKALYALATSFDAVTIWMLVLMSIGVAIVAGVKRSSGYIAVIGWWAIIVLFGVGAAAVRAAIGGWGRCRYPKPGGKNNNVSRAGHTRAWVTRSARWPASRPATRPSNCA